MKLVLDIHSRPTVRLETPKKGSEGDKVIESDLPYTDINFILKRYAGNLGAIEAWRGKLEYGDQSAMPSDLQDVFERMSRAHDDFVNLEDNPFSSFDEAMNAIADGSIVEKIKAHKAAKDKSAESVPSVEEKKGDENHEEK